MWLILARYNNLITTLTLNYDCSLCNLNDVTGVERFVQRVLYKQNEQSG